MIDIIRDNYLWIIIVELIIIILLIILLLYEYLSPKDNSGVIASLEQKNAGLRRMLESMQQKLNQYEYAYKQSQIKLKEWQVWYEKNRPPRDNDSPKNVVENTEDDAKSESLIERRNLSYQYLQEANGSRFIKFFPTPEKCFFRTWEENGVRKYEFCGNVEKALANMNAIFDDVCDIEGKRGGATNIENICPGTLDSDLRIINKAKIRLK